MGWKTLIIGAECKVSLSMNRLKLTIDNEYQNYPLSDIDTIIFSHDRVTITIPLLSALIENNIGVIICDSTNDPIGIVQPFNGHSLVFKQLNKQIEWKVTRKKHLWKMIVEQKIQSEIDTLKLLGKSEPIVRQLIEYRNSVQTADTSNREAVSARLYFSELFGADFSRDKNTATNAALDYGYKILASRISKVVASRGYLTQLGIHHIGESNPFNLSYDFIETFRAIVDYWVYSNIKDEFTTNSKLELINICSMKVNVNNKWFRLDDAIEDIIDSYFLYLAGGSDSIKSINVFSGFIVDEYEE